jgi:GTP-binding protein
MNTDRNDAGTPKILGADFFATADDVRDLPPPVFAEIAFAGKSNVGKSSLINTLIGRRNLARTSSTPGRTRKLCVLRIALEGGVIDLVDLPGYGYAKVSKVERRAWGDMIERFLTERPGLRCVVLIVDIRRGLQDEDVQLLEFLAAHRQSALLVATKMDKLAHNKAAPALQALQKSAGCKVLPFSSETRAGRGQLWRALLAQAGMSPA